jgi:hypothetical protein
LNEEREIPEQLRSIIVDEESEKFVKDIMEKADGLPIVKEKYQQTREALETRNDFLKEIVERRDSGDLHGAAKMLKFSDDEILKLAINIAELRQATPEQQEAYQRYQESLEQGRQANKIISGHEMAQKHQVLNHFDQLLSTEYSRFSKAIPNFKQKVISFAKAHYNETGNDLSPSDALKNYVDILKVSNEGFDSSINTAQNKGSSARDRMNMPRSPNLKSTGASPISKPITNMEEMRNKFRSMARD